MTRITNLGRKRTHVEATFDYNEIDLEDPDAGPPAGGATDEPTADVANAEGGETINEGRSIDGPPPKKKRKRGPRKKAGVKVITGSADGGEDKGEVDGEGAEKKSSETPNKKGKGGKAKMRTIRGPPPIAVSRCFNFIQTPYRAQRSLGKTPSQANSRAECQHYLLRLPRGGPRRTGLPQNC